MPKTLDARKYRVANITEEFECPACGEITWQGDTAWQAGEDGEVACSRGCLAELLSTPHGGR